MHAGSRGALLRQSAVGNSRIVLPPWALSAASSPRAQQAYHLVIHTGGPDIALGPTWQAPATPWKPAQCSRQLRNARNVCRRHVSGAGAPKNTHKVHPGLPFPCHHVCPWCASPWSTVGSLKPHLQWLVHSHFELRRIFAHDRCMTVKTDLPDVEMKQKKGCVTHKTYVPSPGNTHTSLPSPP